MPHSSPRDASDAANATRTFVLDTNVLLHNPDALFVFEENNVVIPFTVLEELDRFKGDHDDIGRNARECIRHLDYLRTRGRLDEGVSFEEVDGAVTHSAQRIRVLKPTGVLRISVEVAERPPAIKLDTPDNRIIAVAYTMHRAGDPVVFVSKDINARIKADALGVRSEDFENQKVNVERLYRGYITREVPGGAIDEMYDERMLALERLAPTPESADKEPGADAAEDSPRDLLPNEFALLIDQTDENHTGLGRRLADTDHVIPVTARSKPTFGIIARNIQQTMALDLLLDDEIKLVTLIGQAGTGKTLMAVAAGMTKVFNEERYEKLLVARPIMPMGRDIGYLPGDKDEKLASWMQPIFDNLAYLMSTRGSPNQTPESHSTEQRITRLMADGRLVLEPLTYIRGRSIPHQFMIVDEAQNLSPHEVKTIVSRVGEGTKIIFTGDIDQIDSPYLDSSSNGLSYCVERMKGSGVVGHVTLAKSERSDLASLATEHL